MSFRRGDQILVNVAPFIGSIIKCHDVVSCTVLDVDGAYVQVETCPPCRQVSLWVVDHWIEGFRPEGVGVDEEQLVSSHA